MAVKKKKHSMRHKAAASAVAAVTAAGVMVGGAFASPQEILEDGPDAVVQTVSMMDAQVDADADGGDADTGEEEIAGEEEEEKRGIRAATRRLVRSAPLGVRALVALPLWALGTAVIALVSSLWASVLSPTMAAVLSWLGLALMAVLIFALAVKAVFPDMPLKKILNRRSILTIVSLCLLFGLVDAVLPFFWDDYQKLSKLLKALGSLLCAGVPVFFFLRRHKNRERQETAAAAPTESPAAEPTLQEREASARALVTELADSVCRKA